MPRVRIIDEDGQQIGVVAVDDTLRRGGFLEEGHKVKVKVRFRGREASHPEVARAQIASIAAGVTDIATVERQPSVEGRTMFAILARGRSQTT